MSAVFAYISHMPRTARIVIPLVPHHITQRGNNQQDVFFTNKDRGVYLKLLKKQSTKYNVEILGYCLMSNHVHILAIPCEEDSLAKSIGRTHLIYAQYINELQKRSGHLWQNRFFSCPLDTRHFWAAMQYIERNPVRANLVEHPADYKYSSAAAHVTQKDPLGLINIKKWREISNGIDWEEVLSRRENEKYVGLIRRHFRTGRPLGTDKFLSKVESYLGKRLRPLPIGRPKNKQK